VATCKFPGCDKTLVGKEKHFCKSCKDKVKDKTLRAGKGVLGAVILIGGTILTLKSATKSNSDREI